MAISLGRSLGPYEILGPIGAGGMGEVYKAKDSRLNRTVAIKVLPEHVAADSERKQRFKREAQAIAALNHPNICVVHDVGEDGGTQYLVLEYLEGETLAARLEKGPLPIDQALKCAVEIADALDKAHQQGFVHRDVKPGNIMLTKSGSKLLDFGLAKLAPLTQSQHSAITGGHELTGQGMILGTLQYMAPEQIEGEEADARSDLFSFGAVLYEMITGKKAFKGKSQASLMASILEHDPVPMSVLQQMTPPALDRVVRTCLAKAPTDRWQTAHDLTLQLKWVAEEGSQVNLPAAAIARSRNRERVIWSLLALSVLGLIVLGIIHFRTPPADAPAVQFSVAAPPDAPFAPANSNAAGQPEVSPDGLHVAFVAYTPGFPSRIWVRSLNSLDAQALPGTEGAGDGLSGLFWSPDSRQIGFFAQGKLKRVDYSGGPVLNVCNLSLAGGRGGTWNRDGVIVFGQNSGGLLRVSAAGGEPAPATTLVASEVTHRWPYFLPDGRHFLYTASSNTAFLGSLDSKETRQQLLNTAIKAIYAPPGYLLFGRQGTLMGQAFDAASLELRGEPFTVAQSVLSDNDIAPPSFWTHSVSSTGLLVYRSGSNVGTTRIGWFDRTGKRLDPINQTGDSTNPRLSPDESRIVVVRQDNVSADLWMIDIARGTNSRLTFNPTNEQLPIWSPDGTQIVYTSDQADLYQKTATGSGSEQLLFKSAGFKVPLDWSADGRFLLFRDTDPKTGSDIWVLPMTGERKPTPFLRTPFLESGARFSPDGKWVAYYSSESGSFEIYVQPFPPTGGKWQVSVDGGTSAEWGKDGKELFFVTPDNRLMSVAIESGTQFRAGVPKLLFQVPGLANPSGTPSRFSVTRDGKRFLFVTSVATTAGSPITVLLNWTSALKK